MCRKAKIGDPASLSRTLEQKECVEVFLAARPEVKRFILQGLPDHTVEELLRTAAGLDGGVVILLD